MKVVEVVKLKKAFDDKVLFDQLSFSVESQSFMGIVGASGTGKTTLLNILGLLDRQDEGDVYLFGNKNVPLSSVKAKKLLRNKIGYIFQNFALCENDTVEYNLKLALFYLKHQNKEKVIQEALHAVHLDGFEKKKVRSLSGGEQQRVAIARILCKPCELILADEPTGNLDQNNAIEIMELMKKLVEEYHKTVICVSHDQNMRHYFDQIIDCSKYREKKDLEM